MNNNPALVLLNKDGSRINYSWKYYETEVARVMRVLKHWGIKMGDFVVLAAPNLPESFFAMLGVIAAGAVPVPICLRLLKEPGQKELRHILNDCKPELTLASASLSKYLDEIQHATFEGLFLRGSLIGGPVEFDIRKPLERDPDPDSLMIMPYTSGTTGNSKGVMLSTNNVLDRVSAVIQVLEVTSQERVLSYMPLGHISELVATFLGQLVGRYTVYFSEYFKNILEEREKFQAAFPSIIQAVRPTIFLGAPKVWENMRTKIHRKTWFMPIHSCGIVRNFVVETVRKKSGLDEARHFISAGSKISQKDLRFFAGFSISIEDIYGQTETAGPLTTDGRVIGNATVILGENNEILVSGPNVMLGYYNNPEATAEVIKDGFYHTGDIGIKGPDGRIYYAGRLRDKAKNAQGEFVDPAKIEELENKLKEIPGIDEAVIYCEGKSYPIAVIFTSDQSKKQKRKLDKLLRNIGSGFYKVGNFMFVDTSLLESFLTPTFKVKRKTLSDKFQAEIEKL